MHNVPRRTQASDFATGHAPGAGLVCRGRLALAIFADCVFIKSSLNSTPSAPMTAAARHLPLGEIMESTVQKSCWGITVRAVLGFGIVLVVAHLFGVI
jgi:hypothetical protein